MPCGVCGLRDASHAAAAPAWDSNQRASHRHLQQHHPPTAAQLLLCVATQTAAGEPQPVPAATPLATHHTAGDDQAAMYETRAHAPTANRKVLLWCMVPARAPAAHTTVPQLVATQTLQCSMAVAAHAQAGDRLQVTGRLALVCCTLALVCAGRSRRRIVVGAHHAQRWTQLHHAGRTQAWPVGLAATT